ncbi:hypothetical protein FIV00_26305 [Labrenzia sp. THAF82]|uniref:tetratricopeptide repeat protein n=1 Tax=Labrenzia sp. THAF82 TaxID=2587861 RepID=UPI0012696391|nr:hypothetical protein [Labrenzia sp. THAF82]QFT34037.1 hypothetical protein FIV00_26305 [Labrenzia sp. THAF82]
MPLPVAQVAGNRYEGAENQFPEDIELVLGVANTRARAGKLSDAICLYLLGAKIDPLNYRVHQGLTNCLLMLRLFEQAVPFASLMIGLEPRNPLGYYFSGLARFSSGCHQEAIEDFEAVLSLKDQVADRAILSKSEVLLSRLKSACDPHIRVV